MAPDKLSSLVKDGNKVIYSSALTKLTISTEKKPKSNYTFVLTSYFIAFCDKKQSKFENKFYYDQIESYNFSEKKITIKYLDNDNETELILESKEIDKIDKMIVKYLRKIFSGSELLKLNIEQSEEEPKPDGRCTVQMSRYFIKSHTEDKDKMDPNYLKAFQSRFKILRPIDPNNSESTLYGALNGADFIESVELFQFPFFLVKDQPQLPFLNLQVSDVDNDIFEQFYSYLSQDLNQGKLTGLCIQKADLSEENFQKLVNLAAEKYVSLSIQYSNIPLKFFQSFDNAEVQNLTMLNLDNCTGINITELIHNTTFLRSLSVANCQINIGDFINELQSKNFENLEMLNLSGNNAGNISSDGVILPQNLQVLNVFNVQWSKNSFLSLLTLLFEDNFIHGLRLNLGYAALDSSSWPEITSYLKNCDPSQLIELNWSGNLVDSDFNEFLRHCQNLEIFRINLTLGNIQDLASFGEAIASISSLKELFAFGYEEHEVGPRIVDFISKLESAPNLKLIDIHSQKIENQGLESVSKLVESCNSIDTINIDGSGFNTINEILSFCNSLAKLNRPIKVSYPDEEIELLKKSENPPSNSDIKKLRIQLSELEKGTAVYQEEPANEAEEPANKKASKKDKSKKSKSKKDKNTKDEEPKDPEPQFIIFRIEDTDFFPIYMNKELEDQLNRTVQPKQPREMEKPKENSEHPEEDISDGIKHKDNNEEEEESNKNRRKSSKKINEINDEEEEPMSNSNKRRKSSKKNKTFDEEEEKPSGKSDKKGRKSSSKNKPIEEEEDNFEMKPGRKSDKKGRKSSSKNKPIEEEEDNFEMKPGRKSDKKGRKSSSKNKPIEEEEDNFETKPGRKSDRKGRKSSSKNKPIEEEEDNFETKPGRKSDRKDRKSSRKSRPIEEEDEEEEQPRRNRKSDRKDRKSSRKSRPTEEEEDEIEPKPSRKSDRKDRKSSRKSRPIEEEDEEEEQPRRNRKSDRKDRKSSRKSRPIEEEDEEEEQPRRNRKSDRKDRRSSRKSRPTEEEEDDNEPRRNRKSDRKDRRSSRKSRPIEEEDEEEEQPRRNRKSDRKDRRSSRKSRPIEEEDEEEEQPRRNRKSDRKDRRSSRSNRRIDDENDYEDEDNSEKPRRKSSDRKGRRSSRSSRRDRRYEDEEDEEEKPRRKASGKSSNRKHSKRDQDEDESSSELTKLTSKRESRKKPVMDSESLTESDSMSSEQDKNKGSRKKKSKTVSSFVDSAPQPKPNQYEQPNWTLPEQLSQKYDPRPVFHKLQKQYDLKVLRDAI